MFARVLVCCLTISQLASAGEPCPVKPADLRVVQEDPTAKLSRFAKGILGKNGGNKLFYLPTRDEPATPATWGYKFENVDFKSSDGTPLHGWFISARTDNPKGTVVFSHGNAGSVGHHLGFVMWLAQAGYHVFTYDYRGFGKSGGSVDRRGMVNDVKAAFACTSRRADVDPAMMVSYGHSLGGAKSVTALGESPVKGLKAVVTEAAFASYLEMAGFIGGQLGASLVTDELSPQAFVANLSPVPLLVVHGTRDEVVPVSQGRTLYQKALQPKTLFEVKAGHHGDSLSRDHGAYRKRVLEWLATAMAKG